MDTVILVPTTTETFGDPPQVLQIPITRLEAASTAAFKAQCQETVAGRPCHLGIDLGTVEFVDSSGLGALVACVKQVQGLGGKASVIAPRPLVLQLLEVSGLARVLTVYGSRREFETV
ncbi:MAG: STAS domain-containing protein [Gloeomargaritaceae cyanobacterium C42_A2020_066]|nr:STAS domain-containing protein [Gloeomargaritaceae cyanobacterium C42_A2020_066]